MPKVVVNDDRIALNGKVFNGNVGEAFAARVVFEPLVYHHLGDDVRADAVQFLDHIRFGNVHVDSTKL